MLCTELPSIEAGTAVPEYLPPEVEGAGDGRGIAMTYTIQPETTWGDGTPVTTKDVLFTWRRGATRPPAPATWNQTSASTPPTSSTTRPPSPTIPDSPSSTLPHTIPASSPRTPRRAEESG